MKNLRKGLIAMLILTLLLLVSGNSAFAGGEVDTSPERFDSADFTNSEFITNHWWTLPAGDNFLYFAEGEDGCEWNLVQVLAATTSNFVGPIYGGTSARIILDRAWLDEECVYDNFTDAYSNLDTEETTYDWYAQDSEENIWYMGEDTVDSEGSSEGSFVAGCDGAEAGIVLLGTQDKGAYYQQEFYEDEAEDVGKVLTFLDIDGLDCVKTKEWTPLETGHNEHKFYCTDGTDGELVKIDEIKGKTVVVDLIARNVAPVPGTPAGPPFMIPSCAP